MQHDHPAPTSRETLRAHLLGTLEGMMIGDALGGPYEFRRRGLYTAVSTHYVPNTTFGLPPGCFTDDTSMALCLAESLLHGVRRQTPRQHEAPPPDPFDPLDVMTRWGAWYGRGHLSALDGICFDIGNQTRACLSTFAASDPPNPHQGGPRKSTNAGNGGIMRLAPVPVFYYGEGRHKVVEMCGVQGRLTHGSALCEDGAALMGAIVFAGLEAAAARADGDARAVRKSALFRPETHTDLALATPEFQALVAGLPDLAAVPPGRVKTSGYVLHTLHAALWAFARHASYMGGMDELLGMGDDVDTVCAVYGAIAGAWYGLEAIPEVLRTTLSARCREMADGIWGPLVEESMKRVA